MQQMFLLDLPRVEIEKLPIIGQNMLIWHEVIEIPRYAGFGEITIEIITTKTITYNTQAKRFYLTVNATEKFVYFLIKTEE